MASTPVSARTTQDSRCKKATCPRPTAEVQHGSLHRAIGFKSFKDPEFADFTGCTVNCKRIMRELAPLYVDVRHKYTEQDPKQIKKYMDMVVEKVPWITRYEDCWPVKVYTRKWLDKTRWDNKHQRPFKDFAEQKANGTAKSELQVSRASRGRPRSQPQAGDRHRHSQEVLHSMSLRRSGAPSSKGAPSTSSPRSASSTIVNEYSAPAGKVAVFEPHMGFVRDFLRGLRPSMEDLTPEFVSAGLVNEMCLVALAEMPDWEKDKLLRDDMSLKPFQMRVVRVGLAELQV